MSDRVYVATRKGLFTVDRTPSKWTISRATFVGDNVTLMMHDPRNGNLFAALNHGHFGIKVHRSTDHGETWSQPMKLTPDVMNVQFPDIAVTGNGNVYVTLRQSATVSGQKDAILIARSTDCGKTFGKPSPRSPGPPTRPRLPGSMRSPRNGGGRTEPSPKAKLMTGPCLLLKFHGPPEAP